jgi:hypothetical protein
MIYDKFLEKNMKDWMCMDVYSEFVCWNWNVREKWNCVFDVLLILMVWFLFVCWLNKLRYVYEYKNIDVTIKIECVRVCALNWYFYLVILYGRFLPNKNEWFVAIWMLFQWLKCISVCTEHRDSKYEYQIVKYFVWS